MRKFSCRHCGTVLRNKVIDLGFAPPSNAYLQTDQLNTPELTFPLRLRVCDNCWLLQTEDFTSADLLFDANYAYFSSTSRNWLKHAADYVEKVTAAFGLSSDSHVLEIASNDGYLLKNFVAAQIPCLGVEPTESTASAAEAIGIPVIKEFFSEKLAHELTRTGNSFDLVIGNNVFAHVPDINDFCRGIAHVLKETGVVSLEVPHVVSLVQGKQFDTIYHEHFSYFSATTIEKIFSAAGLKVFDIEKIPTHGGSIRVYGCLSHANVEKSDTAYQILEQEGLLGVENLEFYGSLQKDAVATKNEFLQFLLTAKAKNKRVAAYGAAAKGNTLINFAGVRRDLLDCVFDAAASKQNKYLPGSHIPIFSPDRITEVNYDYLIVLPWNLVVEIKDTLKGTLCENTKIVTVMPKIEIH